MVLINGLGCAETGARIVLMEMVRAVPPGGRYFLLCTCETASDLVKKRHGRLSEDVYVLGLSHVIFGRWLRPIVELLIALFAVLRIAKTVVNVSHYGICLGGDYVLYIHSPSILDIDSSTGWADGKPNFIKRVMLNTCMRRARLVVLQTRGMLVQLIKYCEASGCPLPNNSVLRPRVELPLGLSLKRIFSFQLFYPTSRFAHKRADLAIAGAMFAHQLNADIGLAITVPRGDLAASSGVYYIGAIDRASVYDWFSGSNALLFTSERETLGLPILEALECGLPVIAPRLPYAVELLGDAGCYFSDPDPASIAEAVMMCHNNYDQWAEKIRQQSAYIRAESASWARHWEIFLNK
jgi:glycosyltransferase involved in cell wall biosynthesis